MLASDRGSSVMELSERGPKSQSAICSGAGSSAGPAYNPGFCIRRLRQDIAADPGNKQAHPTRQIGAYVFGKL